jgi:hypothetical protein
VTDGAIVGGSEASEAEYEEQLANWLAEGLGKPGKLNSELAKLLNVGPSEVSKMKSNKRKILAYQLFVIGTYIEEAIPVPFGAQVSIKNRAIPILGEAGRSAWYENDPQPVPGEVLEYVLDDRFPNLPHFATRVVGDDVNTLLPDDVFAVYVPYLAARKSIADRDFVLIKQVHKNGGLHKRLIRQVFTLPTHQEFRGASHDPKINAAATIRLADDLSHVLGSNEIIEVVGLVVSLCRRLGPE